MSARSVGSEGVRSETIPFIETTSRKIDRLPQDLLARIFSYLSKNDLQAVASINRKISSVVIASANHHEPASIKNFIHVLISHLDAEKFQRKRELLLEISNSVNEQHFVNLHLLKRYILDVKSQLINVIKTVDAEMANHLRDHVHPPHFFEDIFELTAFERQIDAANLISNEYERGDALRDLSIVLIQADKIDRAIAVATSIPNEHVRGFALRDLSKVLAYTATN